MTLSMIGGHFTENGIGANYPSRVCLSIQGNGLGEQHPDTVYNDWQLDMPPTPMVHNVADGAWRHVVHIPKLSWEIFSCRPQPPYFDDFFSRQLRHAVLFTLVIGPPVQDFYTMRTIFSPGDIFEIFCSVIMPIPIFVINLKPICRANKSKGNELMNGRIISLTIYTECDFLVSPFVRCLEDIANARSVSGPRPPNPSHVGCLIKTICPWNVFPNLFHVALSPMKKPLVELLKVRPNSYHKGLDFYCMLLFGRKSIIPQKRLHVSLQ